MKEQDYINAKKLAYLDSAISALSAALDFDSGDDSFIHNAYIEAQCAKTLLFKEINIDAED